MGSNLPPDDHCPSCERPSHISYTHEGITVGPCETHWKMHCNRLVPYDLKKVCGRYDDGVDDG